MLFGRTPTMPTADEALPGRETRPFEVSTAHAVLGTPLEPPFPEGLAVADLAFGCFWGGEEMFWQLDGVYATAVGYQGGHTPNPTYDEVCSGRTGHAEAVRVVYDPARISYRDLLTVFWESHDPTQGMRQGNDVGTQYRSAIYYHDEAQRAVAEHTRAAFGEPLRDRGYGAIATEIAPAGPFYLAEDVHQQYLHKVPNGYRCHSSTGATLPDSS